MDKTSKIYIAGHRGLAGSAILRKLKSRGYQNLLFRTHRELDLTRQQAVESFFDRERPDYVFLAAARVGGILANNTYPADFIRDNLAVQTNVIHAAYLGGVKKLLFLGSSCIYPRDCPQPMKEEYLLSGYLEPTNQPYAVAKIAGIEMCRSYNRQYGTGFISVMPTNLYGPNDNFNLETSHVLAALVRKFHLGKLAMQKDWEGIEKDEKRHGPIPGDLKAALGMPSARTRETKEPEVIIWGTGTPRREFLHVDDLADACLFLMENPRPPEIVNIGTGKDSTIRDMAGMIAAVTGFQGRLRFDTSKPDGTPIKLLDVSRLAKLGWQPGIGFREGIRSVYDWYVRYKI